MMTEQAPRAMAVDRDDPRYRSECQHLIGRIKVFIDGELAGMVIAYDMDAGVIIRLKVDADGHALIEPGTNELAIETVQGTVAVELLPA